MGMGIVSVLLTMMWMAFGVSIIGLVEMWIRWAERRERRNGKRS